MCGEQDHPLRTPRSSCAVKSCAPHIMSGEVGQVKNAAKATEFDPKTQALESEVGQPSPSFGNSSGAHEESDWTGVVFRAKEADKETGIHTVWVRLTWASDGAGELWKMADLIKLKVYGYHGKVNEDGIRIAEPSCKRMEKICNEKGYVKEFRHA